MNDSLKKYGTTRQNLHRKLDRILNNKKYKKVEKLKNIKKATMVFILILLNILALNNLPYGESVSGVYKSAGWMKWLIIPLM